MYAISIQDCKILSSTMSTFVDIPTTLPAPNRTTNNYHTTFLYEKIMMQTAFVVKKMKVKTPIVLTNNNLDCVFAFEFMVESTREFAYFIGCLTLATGTWRWCIPFFVTDDDNNIENFYIHASYSNPNAVTVIYACNLSDDAPEDLRMLIVPSPRTDWFYLCSEEFDVRTGTGITRLEKNRMPTLSAFEFVSENASGVVAQMVQTEDLARDLLTFL